MGMAGQVIAVTVSPAVFWVVLMPCLLFTVWKFCCWILSFGPPPDIPDWVRNDDGWDDDVWSDAEIRSTLRQIGRL